MDRVQRLRDELRSRDLEAVLITDTRNIRYLTGFTGSFAQVVVGPSQATVITDSRYAIQVREECPGWDARTFASPVRGIDFLRDTLTDLGLRRIGFEADTVTYAEWQRWQDSLDGIEFVPASNLMDKLRIVKDASELEAIRQACGMTEACFEYIRPLIQVGVAEMDLALEIDFYFRRQGAASAFDVIAVSGERSARPHGKPSERKLQVGDFLTLDFGAEVGGYCADITRTVVVGEASERHRIIYQAVLDAQKSAIEAMRPGKTGHEIDQIARDALAKYDMAQFFGHGLGHGLGLMVHDFGRLGQNSETVLEPNMVLTVEPGVYIEGFGGCRIEDDVLITENGAQKLTDAGNDLLVL
ncbi:MAG: aminopeptidase P family protein [Fimbriimonadia bacterium]|jgi:Xaa-Pro aminopeptidase